MKQGGSYCSRCVLDQAAPSAVPTLAFAPAVVLRVQKMVHWVEQIGYWEREVELEYQFRVPKSEEKKP